MSTVVDTFRFVRNQQVEALPPPNLARGPIAWIRENLFSGPFNTILTLVVLYLLYVIIPPIVDFVFVNAVWTGTDRDACRAETAGHPVGACWAFVIDKINYFVYGSYPVTERWRVNIFFALLALGVVWLLWLRAPRRDLGAIYFFWLFPILSYILLTGGDADFSNGFWLGFIVLSALIVAGFGAAARFLNAPVKPAVLIGAGIVAVIGITLALLEADWGLQPVPTALWGGILVTLLVATVGIVFSLPFGILLALGRRSKLPIVRMASVIFIEFVRGVPLITVLIMANTMLPLFLPGDMTVDRLARPLIGVAFFASAYMAEVVRGGLQAMPKGQYEGAMSLGLNYPQMMILIILPQALRIVIPGIVNTFIGLFKDTSLVAIVGIFDLIKTIEASRIDPNWAAPTISYTGYAFAALFYFVFCWGMSRYSLGVERRLATGHKH
ncbi:amino acid ABC transporter permease [Microvirga subterranea]|uniref:Amino acid ABC transporter membrane protein 2 (PAAT family) n=1 Tax=Microvirga subterranea TaxID=186651 RepID=A0A370HN65_9HYPH|nr:amino acid ABC transporter permease [Microvirga subterranea]RDI59959.1 amino acid ABC transporter membrane protein 2 (PAAT family) [Microvirga subterranea]